jgi:hypothetical protein
VLSKRKESKIILRLRDADPLDKQDWPRQHQWLAETLISGGVWGDGAVIPLPLGERGERRLRR